MCGPCKCSSSSVYVCLRGTVLFVFLVKFVFVFLYNESYIHSCAQACMHVSEVEASFSRSVRERRHPAVVLVSSPIEGYFGDTFFDAHFSDRLSNHRGGLLVGAVLLPGIDEQRSNRL